MVLAALQAFAYRFDVYSSDDCAYLDQALFFARSDWANAVNGYWSPLYPALLGLAFKIFNPALADQLFVARVVNAVILLGLAISFNCFIQEFLAFYRENTESAASERLQIAERNWQILGGCLFLWLFFAVGAVNQTTPDFLVATSIFLASTIALKLRTSHMPLQYALLGGVLGLGYLSKASMIPVAVTMILLAAWQSGEKTRSIGLSKRLCGIAIAFATLTVVSSPYVLVLADKKGRFEIGSSAGLNYMMSVACKYRPLGPNPAEIVSNCPHPVQTLGTEPNLVAFDSPFEVTFAPWFDPSYFAEGLKVNIDPVASAVSMCTNLISLFFLFGWQISLALLCCFLLTKRLVIEPKDVKSYAVLWLPAVVTALGIACVINLSIGWTTQRYFPPLVLILYLVGFAVCNLPNSEQGKKALKCATAFVCCTALVLLLGRLWTDVSHVVKSEKYRSLLVAQALLDSGLSSGDQVAMIGEEGVEWARLANLKIVAHVSSSNNKNELGTDEAVATLLDKLRRTKACAVVYFPEPFSAYVRDEASRAQGFRDLIAKLTGGQPIVHHQLVLSPSSLSGWKKLPDANVYVLQF